MSARIPEPQPVTLKAEEVALVIVDMQNDFCKKEGKLYVGESCDKTIPKIAELLKVAREKKIPVVYTQDWHQPGDPEFELWGQHTVAGTWGAEVVDELKPAEGDVCVKKQTYDAFYKTDMEQVLEKLGRKTLIVTGTVSNICVMHMVAGASLRGYKTVVPVDCIAALDDYGQEVALFQMANLYRSAITRSDLIKIE